MKPICKAILKCVNCENQNKLVLEPKKIDYVEPGEYLYMKDKLEAEFYIDGKATDQLRNIICKIHEFDKASQSLVDVNIDNIEEIHRFLDSFDVVEGNIICEHCGSEYPISNGMPDFIKK